MHLAFVNDEVHAFQYLFAVDGGMEVIYFK
jgi:hypothetical protein